MERRRTLTNDDLVVLSPSDFRVSVVARTEFQPNNELGGLRSISK